MPNYTDLAYWEKRYLEQKDSSFDWHEDFESLKGIFTDVIKNFQTEAVLNSVNYNFSPNILVLGCGNSELSEKLCREMNLKNIFNIDYSSNVIRTMKDRLPSLFWETMDVKDLKFHNSYFDLIIDKATMDCLLCGDSASLNVAMMLREVQKVLKTGGIYVLVSHGDPEMRMVHLMREHLSFDISVQCLKRPYFVEEHSKEILLEKIHYIYLCKKKSGADQKSSENFQKVYFELQNEDVIEEEEENLFQTN
jgi:ubiquinone/menaquinone biosynthesis C-methylase UbiE